MRLGLPSLHLSISISRPALAVSVCGKMCSEACKLDIKAEAFWGRGRRKEQGARRKQQQQQQQQHCLPLFSGPGRWGGTSLIPP